MNYKYLKNLTKTSADFYVYGDIVDENEPDWWTGEKSATAVDTNAFKEEIDSLDGGKDFNIISFPVAVQCSQVRQWSAC